MGLKYGALFGALALFAAFALPLIWMFLTDRRERRFDVERT
jgi:hypothetical protein